jgi:hypothetical protein
LPIFLTLGIFSLEFIKERIISETENFLKLHKASNFKFPFIIGPFIVKTRLCLSHIQENLKEFGFSQLQGRRYDPHQIISKRMLMNKHALYEHERVEGFDKMENLEVCVDMEEILQQSQTQQVEATLQQSQTQKASQKLIVKVPKMSVYNKRRSSEAMGTSDHKNAPKNMNITQSPHIVDLEKKNLENK